MSSDYQAQLNDICLAKIVYLWLHLKVSIEFQKKFEKRLDVYVDHDEFLRRIAKTLYYGDTSSFNTVSLPLNELATELYNEVKKDNGLERLRMEDVVEINQNACVSTCSLVLAILYLEKIKIINPEYVEKVTPSELFLVSLLVACKFLNDSGEDDAVSNYEWAVSTGIPLKAVNEIEKKFLQAIKWEIYVADKQFWSKLIKVEKYLANQEGKRRGWYSYTELNILLSIYELSVLKELIKQSMFCITCYTSAVLSLIAASLLAIQVKHLFFNYIVYIVMNESSLVVTTIPCSFINTTTSINNNLVYNFNQTKIYTDLILNRNPSKMENNYKNIYDNSFLACYYSNLSSETHSLKMEIASYKWIMQFVQNSKSQFLQKNLNK
ncbi:hypothetical protein PGB90_004065 [Kerria lacca]